MKRNKNILIIVLVLFISITYLSVGFSAASATDKIENIMASVKPTAMARITNIITTNSSGMGVSNSENYNIDKIYGNITLPNPDSSITYKVNVTVYLESIMKISDIINESPNLDYELSDYELGNAICNSNNECNFGATKELYITIKYKEGTYDSSNLTHSFEFNFVLEELDNVAKIGETYYSTLQEAINDVPTNNEKTTIVLLKNTSEDLQVVQNKNIEFDLQNYTLSNKGNTNVIINYGTIYIKNGVITSNASFGAIDNYAGGNIYMSGGSIITTGARQTIYNNGGNVEISGSTYLSSNATERATITNLANSNLTILGGTIVSERRNAVDNAGSLTIGTKDGEVSINKPILQGNTTGVSSTTTFNFYDGTIKGIQNSISDYSKISDIEDDYGLLDSTENINSKIYKTTYLAKIYTVTFTTNGGVCDEASRNVEKGQKVGILPIPTRDGYYFDGWYTEVNDGTKVDKDVVINNDREFFAHWISVADAKKAKIGDVLYKTVQEAINAVPKDNTETTITVLHDTTELLTIENNQNIVLDIQNNVINNDGVSNVIRNNGTLKIISGTIVSNTTQGAINNNKGATLIMTGGSINATGTKQAIYNDGGTLEITGNAILTSTTNQRATVQNLNKGVVTITGGTITSSNYSAVENTATLTIGVKDGNVNANSPVITGRTYGVNNTSKFYFYDGILKGVTNAINGNVNEIEDNTTRVDSTETINNLLYKTTYLN